MKMKPFLCISLLLFAFVGCTKEKSKENKENSPFIEKDEIKGDIIATEWFMCQMGAMAAIANDKYNYGKFEISFEDLIKLQKKEIAQNYDHGKILSGRKNEIEAWLECQEKALSVLKGNKEFYVHKADIKKLPDLIKLLDMQEEELKKLPYSNKGVDIK